jgi:hypothetical protein
MAQVLLLLAIIGYGTFELFRGNFAVMLATAPFLVIYYFFLITRRRG